MKFKNPKTGEVYDLRDGVVVSGFCNHRACKDCPLWNKDTAESCVKRIYEAPYDTTHKMGYEVLEQDYVTWVRVCDDQVDVTGERLSTSGLYRLATLLTGKRFLIDDGKVEIITTEVKEQGEVKTLYALVAIEPTPGTEKLREALESDSPPGFLVSYLVKSQICSICEKDFFTDKCHHMVGQEYDGKTCVRILDEVVEIVDWGFEGWTAGEYRKEKVKTTGVEKKMEKEEKMDERNNEVLENKEEDIERFRMELRQKPHRDWTLGELQKFCQNTQHCSQECPFTSLCDQVWVGFKVPGDWRLESQFTEQDRNDAHKVVEIFGCNGRLKRQGKALLFNGTSINHLLFPGLADGEEVWLKEILEEEYAD